MNIVTKCIKVPGQCSVCGTAITKETCAFIFGNEDNWPSQDDHNYTEITWYCEPCYKDAWIRAIAKFPEEFLPAQGDRLPLAKEN